MSLILAHGVAALFPAARAGENGPKPPSLNGMHDIYIGRQPIVDRNKDLVAFELLFRGAPDGAANVTDGTKATATVIAHAFGEFGLEKVLGERRGFINVDQDLLMSDVLQVLPAKRMVLEILESVRFDAATLERCKALRKEGFRLALDDVTGLDPSLDAVLPLVDVVKVDVLGMEHAALRALATRLSSRPVTLVAEKVEDRATVDICRGLGFELFQGYFFSRPEVMAGKRVDPSKVALLRLLALVLAECDVAEVEKEFKRQPNLAYNLMRMVNSAAGGLRTRIGSVRQAVVVLGRRQLRRWIQLLLYAAGDSQSNLQGALLQTAATRGRVMELLARLERPNDAEYQERAFMAGILSLIDVLMAQPIGEIILQLNLEEGVRKALIDRSGSLGRLLNLVDSKEKNDSVAVARTLEDTPFLSMPDLLKAEFEAVEWAMRLDDPAN